VTHLVAARDAASVHFRPSIRKTGQIGLDFLCIFIYLFIFYVFFHVSLGNFVLLLLAVVVLDLASSVLSQETGEKNVSEMT